MLNFMFFHYQRYTSAIVRAGELRDSFQRNGKAWAGEIIPRPVCPASVLQIFEVSQNGIGHRLCPRALKSQAGQIENLLLGSAAVGGDELELLDVLVGDLPHAGLVFLTDKLREA